jgi:hypothetical protein
VSDAHDLAEAMEVEELARCLDRDRRAVAEAAYERLRVRLVMAYHKHHGGWPQGVFIDDVIAAFAEPSPAVDLPRAIVVKR